MLMLIALIDNNSSLCDKLLQFLEARGFRKIVLSKDTPLADAVVSPNEHHVLVGVRFDELRHLQRTAHIKIVLLEDNHSKSSTLSEWDSIADAHFTQETSEETIVRFVSEALSALPRPGWDQYFIDIAQVVAARGNCMKRQVAAVVVKDHRIVATGYNGTPKGATNCNEGGCERCNTLAPSGTGLDDCVCNHAEENAICQAAYHGISIKDATLYCTHSPCLRCAKLLINAGIKEVVYNADYPMSSRSRALLNECGVICRRYPD